MEEKNDGTFGLLTFVDNDEFNSLKNDIDNLLQKGNYINVNSNYTFNNDICICNISKKYEPHWNNNMVFKENVNKENVNKKKVNKKNENEENDNEKKNNTLYRIVLIKYSENIYYFERNGNISVFNILNKYAFDLFDKTKWNKLFNENMSFKELINNYLINEIKTTNNIKTLDKFFNDNNFENIDFNNINTYEKIYNEIPLLQEELKLIPYNYKTCIQTTKKGDKQSETIYNKNVCENNDKYILLDCKFTHSEGIEVADIYDKINCLFFHNKKSTDLRCLGFQTILGCLILKDEDKCNNYFKKLNKNGIDYTQINTKNYKFVVGVIQTTKTINYKDKITLGIVYCYLKKMNIEFYINKIDVINRTEAETKSNSKPKSKSK